MTLLICINTSYTVWPRARELGKLALAMEAQSPKSLLRAFTTWNTWGVPFASPYLFHRFGKWRAFHDRQLLTFLGEHAPDAIPGGDLIVCCFQEVWSFPKGPLMECTARMDPRKVGEKWERFVLCLGIACRLLSCFVSYLWSG